MRKVMALALAMGVIALAGSANAFDRNNTAIGQGDPGIIEGQYHGSLVAAETATFPVSGDTWSVLYYPYWWNAGDNVMGSRSMSITSINHADCHLVIDLDYLSGTGHVDLNLVISGNTVGSFSILAGQTTVDAALDFPSITVSEPLTLEYYETNTVNSGLGSIVLNETGASSVTLNGGATATENGTWGQVKGLYR